MLILITKYPIPSISTGSNIRPSGLLNILLEMSSSKSPILTLSSLEIVNSSSFKYLVNSILLLNNSIILLACSIDLAFIISISLVSLIV